MPFDITSKLSAINAKIKGYQDQLSSTFSDGYIPKLATETAKPPAAAPTTGTTPPKSSIVDSLFPGVGAVASVASAAVDSYTSLSVSRFAAVALGLIAIGGGIYLFKPGIVNNETTRSLARSAIV